MKAIEIIKAMCYDSALAEQGGTLRWDGSFTLRDYFGAVSHKGEMEYGEYFYVYEQQYDWLAQLPAADVVVATEEAGNVYLWKIEE